MSKIRTISFDGVIVGGGGAGMRAALQLAQSGYKTAVISKVFPTRSHTVSAQGGITCAIASNDPNDQWEWHMYDTVKGSDYIGDQDAIEYMCSVGPEAVFELDHMGLPFSRTEEGRIYQRPFGGQSKNFGEGGQAARTCAAADRTGHALLHTLYQGNLKNNTVFFNEWYATDIVKNQDGAVVGVIAICIETGEVVYVKSKATVFATGGAGRIYASTTNAHINTDPDTDTNTNPRTNTNRNTNRVALILTLTLALTLRQTLILTLTVSNPDANTNPNPTPTLTQP